MSQPRLLLVDDEPGIRATVAANLELAGFEVVEAEDGPRALAALERGRFDLVLSDIRMPGMSGVELFQQIKKKQLDLPVILMTAFALENQINEAISSGVFTVLSKPFEVDDAVPLLRRASANPVVLVLDKPERDQAVTKALSSAGVNADGVSDVTAATKAVESGEVDICIVDDTPSSAIKLRAVSPSIILVVLSDTVSPEVMAKVASAAPFAFLRKPVASDELLATIARARGKVR